MPQQARVSDAVVAWLETTGAMTKVLCLAFHAACCQAREALSSFGGRLVIAWAFWIIKGNT